VKLLPQTLSRNLSVQQLKELNQARGHMPTLSFTQPVSFRAEVARRVAMLDAEFSVRVQGIGARLQGSRKQRSGWSLCISRMCHTFANLFSLGVISEILPHLAFYMVYSLGVSYYAECQDWEIMWTCTKQDAIYYPAVVLSFLLCFRASGCMDRYLEGSRCVFEMEKSLRDTAYEVMSSLSLGTCVAADDLASSAGWNSERNELQELRKRYFKHEFRRLARLLFACAARDLSDSALEHEAPGDEQVAGMDLAMTKVEHAAVMVTHSAFGHASRVYLASAWVLKLVKGLEEEGYFKGEGQVHKSVEHQLHSFKHSWLAAREVAYSSMPGSVTHILWLLTMVMNLFMPWEWVTVCKWNTWFPSLLLVISFYGILVIANDMENPFGFDEDDVQLADVAEHLDEEVCLTMQYSALDEFGGENLYRNLMGIPRILVDEADGDGSGFDGPPMFSKPIASSTPLLGSFG